ncbi:hypothetical protein D8I24_0355 (plasmid) [Cupriavidus necator H850]|uniref:cupin domain-containing protein n=1 Tax=Cupriavidus necator TaxID=106590 RepID=UPI00129D6E25|nr:cupin domain-containing protein [Cupriavidus necator]KAI3610911.1 hypothetical protein D8I24_0355 [Cupriavidus necator H850]
MPDTAKPAAGHSTLAFARLYADDAGESHFGPLAVTIAERNFAPPAPPFMVSPMVEAARQGFLVVPAGWIGILHPSPLRMWIFLLEGEMEFEASDGQIHPLTIGAGLLLEDTTGKGHRSRVIGGTAATLVVVELPGQTA